MTTLTKKLFQDIRTLRVQILTMSLLVGCGVAVLGASWSSYQSLQKAQVHFYDSFRFAHLFAEVTRAPNTLLTGLKQVPGVSLVEPRIIEMALIDLPEQSEPALGRVVSWTAESSLNQIYLKTGRYPEKGPALEVVVHESFAKAHDLRTGDSFFITLKGQKRHVFVSGIGISPEYVFALSPVAPLPDDRHFGVLWMAREEMSSLLNLDGAFNSLSVHVESSASVPEVKSRLEQLLAPFGGRGIYDRKMQLSHMFLDDEIRQQKSMATVVPGIFVLVAAFILHTVMSRLIGLHRTQIAALKALGYYSRSIVLYYWKLVSVILALGTGPGLIAAYFIGQWYALLYEKYFRFPSIDFSLSQESIVLGLLVGFIPGWMASSLALLQVFSLNPAEAMRPPMPAPIHRSLLQFLRALTPKDIQSKMTFRNLFFRPWRTLLTILGVSAATAILINGHFWTDIVNYMIEKQFHQRNREDLEIQLLHPRSPEVISEISRLPGISYVEGARAAPVKIRFGNFTKDSAIIASELQTGAKPLLLEKKDLRNIPPGETLVSEFFKTQWGLKVGDLLQIEPSEKASPPFRVPVAGFIEDVVGATVYVNKRDLHKWLQEAPSINMLFAKIDPNQAASTYIKLKSFPEVVAVNIKQRLYESFTENLSQMILTFTMILVSFAITISGSVLFNMARISLSEKSWELASLKIIGLTTQEIFLVVFLEMGVGIILSLGPGLLLGYGLSYLSTRWIHTEAFTYPLIIDIKTYALALVTIISTYGIIGIFLYFKVRSLNMTAALKARE